MASKVMTGSRAKIYIDNQLIGIFDSCQYNSNIGVEPIHILGRYSPDEITPTSYEAVTLNCSGFRVIGAGIHTLPKFPKVQDILGLEGVTITVVDRQTSKAILTAIGCIGTTSSGGYNARATSKIQINYTGLRIADESGDQGEGGAVSLP